MYLTAYKSLPLVLLVGEGKKSLWDTLCKFNVQLSHDSVPIFLFGAFNDATLDV